MGVSQCFSPSPQVQPQVFQWPPLTSAPSSLTLTALQLQWDPRCSHKEVVPVWRWGVGSSLMAFGAVPQSLLEQGLRRTIWGKERLAMKSPLTITQTLFSPARHGVQPPGAGGPGCCQRLWLPPQPPEEPPPGVFVPGPASRHQSAGQGRSWKLAGSPGLHWHETPRLRLLGTAGKRTQVQSRQQRGHRRGGCGPGRVVGDRGSREAFGLGHCPHFLSNWHSRLGVEGIEGAGPMRAGQSWTFLRTGDS